MRDCCGTSFASTICESLSWVRANGNLKERPGLLRVPRVGPLLEAEGIGAYSSHRERRIQSKLNSESGEAERSSKR